MHAVSWTLKQPENKKVVFAPRSNPKKDASLHTLAKVKNNQGLKEVVSRDEYFLKVLKIIPSVYRICADGFKI
jgi:hypothetical protein